MKEKVIKIPGERIEQIILLIRGQKIIIDADLATLYTVSTKVLNQAVKRNSKRFPADFMFQLTSQEKNELVTICDRFQKLKHSSVLPRAFTEQGVAMLSTVLNSDRAIEVNIEIMRAFVRLRQMLLTHAELAKKLELLERKYDAQFKVVFEAIRQLMIPPVSPKRKIGFDLKEKQARYGKKKEPKKSKRNNLNVRSL
jgi:phage-related protein